MVTELECAVVGVYGSNIYAVTPTGKILSVVLAALGMMMFPFLYVTSLVQQANKRKEEYYLNIIDFIQSLSRYFRNHLLFRLRLFLSFPCYVGIFGEGNALAIVVGWLSGSKASGLFISFSDTSPC